MTRFTFALIAASIATYASCRGHRIEPVPGPDGRGGGSALSTTTSSSTGAPAPLPACKTSTYPAACPNGLNSECRGPNDNPCVVARCGEGRLCEFTPKAQTTPCDPATHDLFHWWCDEATVNEARTSECCPHHAALPVKAVSP